MKYLCLVYFEDATLTALPPAERTVLDRESLAYDDELDRGGHLLAAQALQSVREAACVRVRNGRASVTDGPFAETKEQLGGFILVEAHDMNEAIRLAGGIPLARLGTIEVRPIYEIPV
jgi:hypothetical protein